MGEVAVSVVVPVYNSEKYLKQCLDSVAAQTLRNIEIICVDDGSTDGSVNILREYAAKDSRFRILLQKNQYAGVARNTGKAYARGKYLVFWDSDDFFDITALKRMYSQCEKDHADICVCSGKDYFENEHLTAYSTRYIRSGELPSKIPFSRESDPDIILTFTNAAVWNKMFLRSFIEDNHLSFHATKNANDVFFVETALCLAKRITVVNKALVVYRRSKPFGLVYGLASSGIDVAINEWVLIARHLRSLGIMPERSFANKALDSIFYVINNTIDFDSFKNAYLKLQTSFLDTLCIRTDVEDGYYESPFFGSAAVHFHQDSAEQFLKWYTYYLAEKETLGSAKRRHFLEKYRLATTYDALSRWMKM